MMYEMFLGLSRGSGGMLPRKIVKIKPSKLAKIVVQGNFIEDFLTSRDTISAHNFF